jgi:hypothetical protein
MKTRGSGGIAPPFLALAVDGSEWSASRPCRFTPGERAPDTHWIGNWMDAVEKRKILLCRASNQGRPVLSPTLYRLSYPGSRPLMGNLFSLRADGGIISKSFAREIYSSGTVK